MEGSLITLSDNDDVCLLSDADMAQLLWGVTPEQVVPSGK